MVSSQMGGFRMKENCRLSLKLLLMRGISRREEQRLFILAGGVLDGYFMFPLGQKAARMVL